MGDSRGAYRVLMAKPKGKKPLGIPRHRWEANFKIDLQKMGGGSGLDCSGSGYGQMAGSCECGNELSGSMKCKEFLD